MLSLLSLQQEKDGLIENQQLSLYQRIDIAGQVAKPEPAEMSRSRETLRRSAYHGQKPL